jgi:hypothetical protein
MEVQPDGVAGGPTVQRILLGSQLRRLRESSGLSRAEAGWKIRSSESKISRMELGRVGFKERDVEDLLTLYGVTGEQERTALLTMARQANSPGWWHGYRDVLPNWFQSYLGLEEAAKLIRTYEAQFVPGLLQTHDYAQAVVRLGHGTAGAEGIGRRASLRMQRQQMLTRPGAPHLWAVLDEAVLRRPIGGRAVMRAQIASLIEAAERPNITIQIVPFQVGGHAAAGGPFTLLRFPDPDIPDVVYLEQLTGALYLDKREDLDHYAAAMERLCVAALPATRTVGALEKMLADYDAGR